MVSSRTSERRSLIQCRACRMMFIQVNCIVLLLSTVIKTSGDSAITVTLPGDATMDMVWVDSGRFQMGTTIEQEELLRTRNMWSLHWENEKPAQFGALEKTVTTRWAQKDQKHRFQAKRNNPKIQKIK